MMCDNTNRGFRTQLASILEKLTKVALVEIGNLAEECSSVLHAEITQHKSANEALKKKCYALEIQLRAARGPQNYTANAHTASRRQIGNHGSEKFVSGQQPAAPAIESVFGKDWCIDLWRDDKLQPQSKGTVESAATRNVAIPPVIDLRDGEPDLILVKEEMYDDQPVQHMTRIADNRKSVEVFDETSLHGAGGEQTLQTSDFNSFPVTSGSQTQHTQHTQPMLMDNIIDDSALSSLVEDPNPATAMGEFSDYSNNMHTNATKETAMELRPVKPPKQFECLFCGKIFNYMSSLKVHIRRHSGEKPFSCTVCGKRFAQKTYVKLHQRVHSGEKPYSCQACGKSFSQKSTLNIHLRTHTGEKPYNCVDCGKSYAYKYGFNHHQCLN